MQIAYHIGANLTDEDRLIKSLLKNKAKFRDHGIVIPGPGKYRILLRETLQKLDGAQPSPETREILLDSILDEEDATRVVLSHDAFICIPNRVFENGRFYHLVDQKLGGLNRIFKEDDISIFMGMRNPATFIPALFEQSRFDDFGEFMRNMDPRDVLWSDVIRNIQSIAPDVELTVWANEDTPLIWAQLIREIAGVDPMEPITGGYDLLNAIMSKDGMARFHSYLKSHPPQTEVQKRRIIAAFLDKFALEDEIEETLNAPGWNDDLVEELTEIYEDDLEDISRMPGVTLIEP